MVSFVAIPGPATLVFAERQLPSWGRARPLPGLRLVPPPAVYDACQGVFLCLGFPVDKIWITTVPPLRCFVAQDRC